MRYRPFAVYSLLAVLLGAGFALVWIAATGEYRLGDSRNPGGHALFNDQARLGVRLAQMRFSHSVCDL